MIRAAWLVIGLLSLALGALGIFLPILPTVPFAIFAAFCFARSHPGLERRLIEHPHFGAHIQAWRSRGAISRAGKKAALVAFAASAVIGLVFLSFPWAGIPLAAALLGGTYVWTRPE